VARKLLEKYGITLESGTVRVGNVEARRWVTGESGRNPVRCPDPDAVEAMVAAVQKAREEKDSVGGIVEIRAQGVPAGLGDPVFGKLDGELARALMSIGAVKAVEVGDGFALVGMRGSESNDALGPTGFLTNRAGGIVGGITNGEPVVLRAAVKPTSSIEKPQDTIDQEGRPCRIEIKGRHDPCICPRIGPVTEAMVALVLADALLRQRALRPEAGEWAGE
jgi:chorismate synthase